MKSTVLKWVGTLTVSAVLVGCQSAEPVEEKQETPVAEASEQNEQKNDAHNHDHDHADEEAKKIYAGYFEDDQIQDRALTDWEGDWQSVYPYLLDGTLDEVFEHKAANG